MKQPGSKDLEQYLKAWANMMINIWEEKLILLDVNDTWELYNSFVTHVFIHSGGDGAKIDFAFNQYGFYSNEGVGKEMLQDNGGDVETTRVAKPWFDKGWYRSVYALRRDVAKIYGEMIAKKIVFTLQNK